MQGEKLLSLVKAQNLSGDVYSERRISHSVAFENNRFKAIETNESSGSGLRIKNLKGQEGFSYGNQENSSILEKALALSQFGDKVEYEFPSSLKTKNHPLVFEAVLNLEAQSLIEQGNEGIKALLKAFPQLNISIGFDWGKQTTSFLNSNGIKASYDKTFFSASVVAMKAENQEILETYEYFISHQYQDILNPLINQVLESLNHASKRASLPSGFYPVIFTPKALRSFIDILLTGFNGKLIEKKVSPILELLGTQGASPLLSLIETGYHPELAGNTPFDGEGIATQEKFLIQEGVFKQGVFDLKTAQKTKNTPLGNAKRGFSSLPAPGFHNLVLLPGEKSLKEIQKNITKGIVVDQFLGAGMSNVMAGEFSANIDLGYVIQKGQIVGRVKDTMVSGNVFDMAKKIAAISKEQIPYGSSLFSWVLFDGVQISC